MNKVLYKVEEYNRHIPLLLTEHETGYVHSKFNNGFNLKMGESSLVFVGTNEGGKLPFAFHLQKSDVHEIISKINVSDSVVWDSRNKVLSLNESCGIMYLEGKPYDNKLEEIPGSEHLLVRYLETILLALARHNEPTGLDLDLNDFMASYVQNDSKATGEYERYEQLLNVLYSDKEEEVEQVLRYFLGRGKGGTPTGDDHIIGLMAIHTIANVWSEKFPKVLERLVYSEKITTDVSIEYLKYALKGQFGSSVIELITAMTEDNEMNVNEKIQNLILMGHSSGLDTLFGIVLGLLALRRKMNG